MPSKPIKKTTENARAALLAASKKLFAAHGYAATSVKMLAEEAGVNVSLVSYYFDSKAGLLSACLNSMATENFRAAERFLEAPKSLEEFKLRLEIFFEEVILCIISEPDLHRIMQRELEDGGTESFQLFKETFGKSRQTLVSFFKTAQERGYICKEADVETVVALSMGSIVNSSRSDFITRKITGRTVTDKKYRSSLINHAVGMILGLSLINKKQGKAK